MTQSGRWCSTAAPGIAGNGPCPCHYCEVPTSVNYLCLSAELPAALGRIAVRDRPPLLHAHQLRLPQPGGWPPGRALAGATGSGAPFGSPRQVPWAVECGLERKGHIAVLGPPQAGGCLLSPDRRRRARVGVGHGSHGSLGPAPSRATRSRWGSDGASHGRCHVTAAGGCGGPGRQLLGMGAGTWGRTRRRGGQQRAARAEGQSARALGRCVALRWCCGNCAGWG